MGAYGLTREQNIDLLVETALEYGITDHRQIAYILATAQHESDNFATSREYDGPRQAIRNGYSGGENYYGRGYVQVTHDHRYDVMATTLNDPRIRDNPDIVAQDATLGAQTTVVGMVRGLYTGVGIDQYINGSRTDYAAARAVVNGNDRAERIAGYASEWEENVQGVIDRVTRDGITPQVMPGSPMNDGALSRGEVGPEVRRLQEALVRDGATITADGNFGNGTRAAVIDYQRRHELPQTGVADAAMLEDLGVQPQQGQAIEPRQPSPSVPELSEPNRSMLDKLREGVRALDHQAGRQWSEEDRERLSASLLAEARTRGFSERDDLVVALNTPTDRLAGGELVHTFKQGSRGSSDPAADRFSLIAQDARSTPVEESFARAEAAMRTQVETQQLAQQQETQRQQAEQGMRV